jgi:hypothetical protein
MDRHAIRQYLQRDWQAVSASKVAYWATRFREEGWTPAWEAANALLVDMRRARPDYPAEEDLERDLAMHVTVRQRLDRVADALARR